MKVAKELGHEISPFIQPSVIPAHDLKRLRLPAY